MDEVIIVDKYLRNSIIEMLEMPRSFKGPFSQKDLLCLETLTINDKNIESISGLEYATNLKSLNLSNNNIIDITPISTLMNLRILNISHNYITNLESLSGLSNLTYLNVSDNQIMNIDSLNSLGELVYLNISNNQICNLSNLSELSKLIKCDAINQSIGIFTQKIIENGGFTVSLDLLKDRYGSSPNINYISDNGHYDLVDNSVTWLNLVKSKEYDFKFKTSEGFSGNIFVKIDIVKGNRVIS